jgi:hypothetical protein
MRSEGGDQVEDADSAQTSALHATYDYLPVGIQRGPRHRRDLERNRPPTRDRRQWSCPGWSGACRAMLWWFALSCR